MTTTSRQDDEPASSDPVSLAVCELLLRYQHGHFAPPVRTRLAEIIRADPPDALERLERAAAYLGLDGRAATDRPLPSGLTF